MVCEKKYDSEKMHFVISGAGPGCGVITPSSVKKDSMKSAQKNASLRSRPQKGGGEVGKTKPLCPQTPSIPPKKAPVEGSSPSSGMFLASAQHGLKAQQLASAATAGNRSCSQVGGRKTRRKKGHKKKKRGMNTRKGKKSRRHRRSKSRKTRK